MNRWLDLTLVVIAVSGSLLYAIYALGPRRVKNWYSRLATRYFGLGAARWFARANGTSCDNCASKTHHKSGV